MILAACLLLAAPSLQLVSAWVVSAVLLLALAWCLRGVRSGRLRPPCGQALFLALLGLSVLQARAWLSIEGGVIEGGGQAGLDLGLRVLAGLLGAGAALAALTGLKGIVDEGEEFSAGGAHALLALLLGPLGLGLAAFGGAVQSEGPSAPTAPTPAAGLPALRGGKPVWRGLRLEQGNLSLKLPGAPWTRSETLASPALHGLGVVGHHEPEGRAQLTLRRRDPEVTLQVSADLLTSYSPYPTLRELVTDALIKASSSLQLRKVQAHYVSEIKGLQLMGTGTLPGVRGRVYFEAWVGMLFGWRYAVWAWGPPSSANDVRQSMYELLPSLRPLDRSKAFTTRPYTPTEPFQSAFGYRVPQLRAEDFWRRKSEETLAQENSAAEVGFNAEGSSLTVFPLSLLGHEVHLEELVAAFLAQVGQSYPSEEVRKVAALEREELRGVLLRWERRDEDDWDWHYYALVARGGGKAWLVLGVWPMRADVERIKRAVAAVQLDASAAAPTRLQLSRFQRAVHASYFNRLAGARWEREDTEGALRLYAQARELVPNVEQVIYELRCLQRLERYEEALEHIGSLVPELQADQHIGSWRAFLLKRLDRTQEAAEAYEAIFKAGYRDDRDLDDYARALWELGRKEEAQQAIARYAAEPEGGALRMLPIDLHLGSGDHEAAGAYLAKLRAKTPGFDPQLVRAQVRVHLVAKEHRKVIEVCQTLIDREVDEADVWWVKGLAEFELRWYRKAKASLEHAKRRSKEPLPGIDDLLQTLRAQVGEGEQTASREPIEPVLLPAGLLSSGASAQPSETGARYDYHLRAVHFVPGEVARVTDYQRIRAQDAERVRELSTFSLGFDPTYERIYVNRLRVFDAQGRLVQEGERSSFYVLDPKSDIPTLAKELNVPVPGLSPGRSVELVYTRERLHPPSSFWLEERCLSRTHPAALSGLLLRGELGALEVRKSAGVRERRLGEDLLLSVEDPLPYRAEPYARHPFRYLPTVRVSAAKASWETLARDYLVRLEDVLKPSPAVKKLARELAQGAEGEERALRVVQHVRELLHYKAIAFGVRGMVPARCEQVIERRYGDCKEHSLLLYQLLRALGLEAHLALVRTAAPIDASLPSLDAFDHMIVYLAGKQGGRFFDATDKSFSTSLVSPFALGGRQALILTPKGARLQAIPSPAPSSSQVRVVRQLEAEGGDLRCRETAELRGFWAGFLRSYLRGKRADEQRAGLSSFLEQAGPVKLESCEIEGLEGARDPLRLKLRYRRPGVLHELEGTWVGRLSEPWLAYCLPGPTQGERTAPFGLRYPVELELDVRLRGERLDLKPAPAAPRQGRFLRVEQSVAREGEQTRVRTKVALLAGNHPAPAYAALRKEAEATQRATERTFVLK